MEKEILEIEFNHSCPIERVVEELEKYKSNGQSVYINCGGGIILYSDDVTLDSAYLAITGKTKADFDKYAAELMKKDCKKWEKRKKAAIKKIPIWIEKGKTLIASDKFDMWEKTVVSRVTDVYYGRDLDVAIEIMEKLAAGKTITKVKKTMPKSLTGMNYSRIRNMVSEFSPRGKEFRDNTYV